MRLIVIIFSLLQGFDGFCQNRVPEIDFQSHDCVPFETFKTEFDSSSLYVIWGNSNHWLKGQKFEMLQIRNNSKIRRFEIFFSFDEFSKVKINRKWLSKRKQRFIIQSVQSLLSNNAYKLNSDLLNIETKTVEKDGLINSESLTISDGNTISFYLIQFDDCIFYQSYSPLSFIEREYPGAKERQKLINLIERFDLMLQ